MILDQKIPVKTYKKPTTPWKTGPDPDLHRLYVRYRKKKAWCIWSKHEWELTFRQLFELVKHRMNDNYKIYRLDRTKPWSVDNIEIRYEDHKI